MNDVYAVLALYVGLNALIFVALTANVGAHRTSKRVMQPGDMGDAGLTRAVRAHANFAEYVPLALLILAALALTGTAALPIHALGATLTFARVLHGFGMMRDTHPNALRLTGSVLTVLVILFGGALCLLRVYEAAAL
jgi:uncharacterized membrane protein YecN with MAPEG domain